MRLTIAAVGRLKSGPEFELLVDYLARCNAAGRSLSLGPVEVREVDERKARNNAAQAERLLSHVPSGALSIALDERGKTMSSPDFAKLLSRERDAGTAEIVFLIGGADGHVETLRSTTGRMLSLGPMVWPHMLARVMLSEQLYRAAAILAGTPYHRG